MTKQGDIARHNIGLSFDEDPNGYWVRYDDYLAALENKADIAESDLAMENMRLRAENERLRSVLREIAECDMCQANHGTMVAREALGMLRPADEPGAGLSDKDLLHAAIDGIKALSQGTAHTEYDSGYEQALREAIGILSQRLPERTTERRSD